MAHWLMGAHPVRLWKYSTQQVIASNAFSAPPVPANDVDTVKLRRCEAIVSMLTPNFADVIARQCSTQLKASSKDFTTGHGFGDLEQLI